MAGSASNASERNEMLAFRTWLKIAFRSSRDEPYESVSLSAELLRAPFEPTRN